MWTRRVLAVTIAALLCVPASMAAAPTEVKLTIAKTQRLIYAYGTVAPAQADRRVRIRFFYNDDTGYVLAATKWDRLSSSGKYEVTFERPTTGTCKVQARFKTRAGNIVKDEKTFECRIPDFTTGTASITSGLTLLHTVDVQIANEGAEHAYGLMYRRWLGENKGMAFLFGGETNGSFYMLNTLIPLSIAFYDSTGQIVKIMDMDPCTREQEEGPGGCPTYNPETSYVGALEVNQGAFDTWGVSEGDFISVSEDQ